MLSLRVQLAEILGAVYDIRISLSFRDGIKNISTFLFLVESSRNEAKGLR